jgi:hypothetical protein
VNVQVKRVAENFTAFLLLFSAMSHAPLAQNFLLPLWQCEISFAVERALPSPSTWRSEQRQKRAFYVQREGLLKANELMRRYTTFFPFEYAGVKDKKRYWYYKHFVLMKSSMNTAEILRNNNQKLIGACNV